jgi:hypothetical protein
VQSKVKKSLDIFVVLAILLLCLFEEREMEGWTLDLAKRDFQLGIIKSFVIAQEGDGWKIQLIARTATQTVTAPLVEARNKKKVRVYKHINSAINALREVGFSADSLSGVN